jgi:hypothetical protein
MRKIIILCFISFMLAPLAAHASWSNLWMSDNAEYKIDGDEVTFWVERIDNDNWFYTSRTLKLKLVATEEPYFDNDGYAYTLGTYELGRLNAGGVLQDIEITTNFSPPP